jgi:integrase
MNTFTRENMVSITPVCVNKMVFTGSLELMNAQEILISKIETGNLVTDELSKAELDLALFMFFAAVSSLICLPSGLCALYKVVLSNELDLHENGGRFHIEVNQKLDGMGSNSNNGEQRTTLFPCYLDPLAMSALHKYLTSNDCPQIESSEDNLLNLINRLLSICDSRPFKTVKAFCNAATELLRRNDDVSIPVFLAEFAKGNNPSHSMPLTSLHLFHNQVTKSEFQVFPLKRVSKKEQRDKSSERTPINVDYESDIMVDVLYSRLNDMLKVNREAHQPEEISKLINYLENRIAQLTSLNQSAVILLSWFIDSLKSKKWKHAETPKKYLKTIGKSWLNVVTDNELSILDGAEMDVLCQAIIDDKDATSETPSRLRDLMIYAVGHFEITAPDDPFYTIIDDEKYVRSTIIPEQVVHQVGLDLHRNNASKGKHFQDTMDAMYVLMSRLGGRTTDWTRLRIKDVELSEQGWILIRPSNGKALKTIQSKRKIPFGVLLKTDERNLFQNFVALRRQQLGKKSRQNLFSKDEFNDQPFSNAELEKHIGSLVSQYMKMYVPVYQFRHTCATSLTMVIFGSDELIEQYTPYCLKQANNIKRFLIGSRRRDKLWAIAALMGHQTPKTTLFHYIHCLDLLLHDRLCQQQHNYTAQFWLQLSGLPARAIAELAKKVELSSNGNQSKCLTTKDIYPLLQRKLGRFVTNASVKDRRNFEQEAIELNVVEPDMIQCLKVLQQVDDGKSMADVKLNSPVDEQSVQAWIDAARDIAKRYLTQQKNPRLVSEVGKICPRLRSIEMADLDVIRTAFKGEYKKQRDEIQWCIEYALSHVIDTKVYIQFSSVNDYRRFMKAMLKIAPGHQWRLILAGNEKAQIGSKKWQRFSQVPFEQSFCETDLNLVGKLYFITAKDSDKNVVKGSRLIRCLLHLAKIMIETEQAKKIRSNSISKQLSPATIIDSQNHTRGN